MIVYDMMKSEVYYQGKDKQEVEKFFCGETLDELATTLINLKSGSYNLQEAYTLIQKYALGEYLKKVSSSESQVTKVKDVYGRECTIDGVSSKEPC